MCVHNAAAPSPIGALRTRIWSTVTWWRLHVVNQHHFHHPEHVDGHVAVFGERHHKQAQRPGMLGVVLRSAAVGVQRLPDDVLEPVALDEERHLASEAISGLHARILGQVRTFYRARAVRAQSG